jgi:hypothetical protein
MSSGWIVTAPGNQKRFWRDVAAVLSEFEPDRNGSKEVQRVHQPCCIKKERERNPARPRSSSMRIIFFIL